MNIRIAHQVKVVILSCMLLLLLLPLTLIHVYADGKNEPNQDGEQGQAVFIIPVHQTIESGLQSFLIRAFKEAEIAHAKYIILDINTLGGRMDSATDIGERIRNSKIPTAAYVHGKAASAGSYLALNAGTIIMEPGSSIGAAAVVDGSGKEVDSAKIISYWSGEMRAAAELRGRNPAIAEAMVDKSRGLSLPEIGKTFGQGEIVSLTAAEAVKVGYAEKLATNMEEVLSYLNVKDSPTVDFQPSYAERVARWLINPVVATLLLLIGIAGVAIEIFVPGFGVPGILGIIGFGLYFFGHYVTGFAGVEQLALFVIGIILLVIEVFLPTFGIVGIAGITCVFGGVIMAAYDTASAALSLSIAFGCAVIIVVIVGKIFKHKGIWNRFILNTEQKKEFGFTTSSSQEYLLGMQGISLTPLRPAGTGKLNNSRIDVVTSGEFIAHNKKIEVIRIEGSRVIVRELTE